MVEAAEPAEARAAAAPPDDSSAEALLWDVPGDDVPGDAAPQTRTPPPLYAWVAGEASVVGASVAATLLQDYAAPSVPQRGCRIWGGETTVTLGESPPGLGGRCQELALSAARVLSGSPPRVSLLAAGTDGRDGPTDAAGALVDAPIAAAASERGMQPADYLKRNDAYHFFEPLGGLIKTGPTHTNVCDVRVLLVSS